MYAMGLGHKFSLHLSWPFPCIVCQDDNNLHFQNYNILSIQCEQVGCCHFRQFVLVLHSLLQYQSQSFPKRKVKKHFFVLSNKTTTGLQFKTKSLKHSLYCKQYGPRSDWSQGISLIKSLRVCFHDKIWSEGHLNICSRHKKQTTYSGQKILQALEPSFETKLFHFRGEFSVKSGKLINR